MFGLYSVESVRAAERDVLARVPEGSLMQTAARGLAVRCVRLVREVRGTIGGAQVVVLVGSGNNGGDALFAAAHLADRGMAVDAVCLSETFHEQGAAALVRSGGRVRGVAGLDLGALITDADLILDGIVGIGAGGALRESAAQVVEQANSAGGLRVAVDLPSGVDADSGGVPGEAFDADVTVTFGCYKPGLFLHPAARYAGAVHLVDIGLGEDLSEPEYRVLEVPDVASLLPPPNDDDHKYRRGVVAVTAGSRAFPGAAVLTVGAARYSGVGMVRFLDRGDRAAMGVLGAYPDVVADASDLRQDPRVRAWACGPGFTPEDGSTVRMVLESDVPVVLDAGALGCISDSRELRDLLVQRSNFERTTVITPHSGEFARLAKAFGNLGSPAELAHATGAIVLLKGPGSTMWTPDGAAYVDTAGTPDLACAGSGDVLTGLLAGMLAAHPDADPGLLSAGAAWVHGCAGRLASQGERPVVATDIRDAVPETIARVRTGDLAGLRA